jgi:hypothetical protein
VSVTRKGRTSSYGDGNQIESMHIDPAGHLWVTDGSTVTRIDDVADVATAPSSTWCRAHGSRPDSRV